MVEHCWYWPFHSWMYSSSFDTTFPDPIWSEYRYCKTCGREQSRFVGYLGPYVRWKNEDDSGDREQAQRYVEACAEHARSTERLALLDEMKDAPVEEIKKRLAERGLMLKVDR